MSPPSSASSAHSLRGLYMMSSAGTARRPTIPSVQEAAGRERATAACTWTKVSYAEAARVLTVACSAGLSGAAGGVTPVPAVRGTGCCGVLPTCPSDCCPCSPGLAVLLLAGPETTGLGGDCLSLNGSK
jgi:hypothetical protein